LAYVSWKDHAAALAWHRAADNYPAYITLSSSILAEPATFITPWTIWRGDDAGQPYAGMQQASLGSELIRGGQRWGDANLISCGQRMLEVCRLRQRNGGLRADDGAWVFSRTGEDHTNAGNTLNQEIYLARDMIEGGRLIGRQDYIDIGINAIAQIGDLGRFPNGWTFVLGGKFTPKKKSWLYYDAKTNGQGDFTAGDNGGYDVGVLRTLRQISLLYAGVNFGPLKAWTRFCADSYRAKGNIHADSTPATGGNWKACEAKVEPLNGTELAWLDNPS
jgi:hypothetical protein